MIYKLVVFGKHSGEIPFKEDHYIIHRFMLVGTGYVYLK